MKKIATIGVISLLLCSLFIGLVPSSVALGDEWIIDSDTVYIDDANVYLSATPHTISSWGWVYFNLTSKTYTEDIDVVWGFNLPTVKPTKAELYAPHWDNTTTNHEQTFYNVSSFLPSSDACDFGNSYNPLHYNITYETCDVWNETTFECEAYKTVSSIVCFDFYTNESNDYTAYWYTEHPNWVLWKDIISSLTKINYNHGGMNTWYYVKNIPVVAGKSYQVRAWVDIVPSLDSTEGKYWWAIKPSSKTIQQAISNNHFYALDPWIDDPGWLYRKTINITGQSGAGTYYQVNLSIGDSSGGNFHLEGHCMDFPNDTVVTDDDGTTKIPFWIENASVDPIQMWVNVSDNLNTSQDVCIYYGKSGESSASNGANTFPVLFDDFNRADSATVGNSWTESEPGTCTCEILSNELKLHDTTITDNPYVYKSVSFPSRPFAVDFTGRTTDNLYAYWQLWDTGTLWRLGFWEGANSGGFGIDNAQLYNGTNSVDISGVDQSVDNDFILVVFASEAKLYVNDVYKDNIAITSTQPNMVRILTGGSQTGYQFTDIIKVRKYNDPEPAFSSAGSEESVYYYIPPDPTNIQNNTDNFYVNFTWDAGSGNITNSYNITINGTYHNGTTSTFFNQTTTPDGWVNITVYAFNSSGSGTLSTDNVSDEVQAPSVSTKKLYETSTSDFSATVAIIDLAASRDSTANNVDYELASGNLYNYVNATSSAIGEDIKIPTGTTVNFSGYFDDGDRVNNAYATWKFYKVVGATTTLICQKGDDSTGGVQIPDGTTGTITGNCAVTSTVTLDSTDTVRLIMNVWAETIGGGGAATKVAKHYWDDTHESWVEYKYQLTTTDTSFTVTLPSGYTYAHFQPPNSTAKNYSCNGQNSTTAFYDVTNTGNVNLDVRMQLNATVTNIIFRADTDNNPSGSSIIQTTLVTLYSDLTPSNSIDIWLWSDFNHTIEQSTNRTLDINVSQ